MAIADIGPMGALSFNATVDDPERIKGNRRGGAGSYPQMARPTGIEPVFSP
jgi:hypothetical protein